MSIKIEAACDYRGDDWPHMTCAAGRLTIWANPGLLAFLGII